MDKKNPIRVVICRQVFFVFNILEKSEHFYSANKMVPDNRRLCTIKNRSVDFKKKNVIKNPVTEPVGRSSGRFQSSVVILLSRKDVI